MAQKKTTKRTKATTKKADSKPKIYEHQNFQRAVANGFVDYVPDGVTRNQVTWNWPLIKQIWAVDNDHKTIKRFCDYWGIHYGRARQMLKVADKDEQDATRATLGKMILDAINLPSQEHIQSAGELIGITLGGALDNINAINQYVSARLINISMDGKRQVNIRLEPTEVARLALIQKRGTDQLSRLLDVQHIIREETDIPHDARFEPTEQDVPDQSMVIARITKGGGATTTKAEGE